MSNYMFANIWKAVNVIIFFVIVYKYTKKPIKDMFEKAYKSAVKTVEGPLSELLSNREAVSMAKKELEEAKKKYESMIQSQKALIDEQYQEILNHAKIIAQNIELRGKEMVEVETNRLKSELLSSLSTSLITKADSKLKDLFKDEQLEIAYIKSKLGSLSDEDK